jgi:hypothetical protein
MLYSGEYNTAHGSVTFFADASCRITLLLDITLEKYDSRRLLSCFIDPLVHRRRQLG